MILYYLNSSRVLRKDLPIASNGAVSKHEQNDIEDDINVNKMNFIFLINL